MPRPGSIPYNERMRHVIKASTLAISVALLGVWGCSRLGPTPVLEPVRTEIKATPKTKRILVTPTSNTGTAEPAADVNRIVPAGAYGRYDDSVIVSAALDRTLKSLAMPAQVAPLLTVNWQAAFHRWLASAAKLGKTPKKSLPVPEGESREAKTEDDLRRLAAALNEDLKPLDYVARAVATGNGEAVAKAQAKRAKEMRQVESLLRHIMSRMDVTYVLVSHLDGDEDAFDKDLPINLHVALVNSKTGAFRYYARSTGRKSDLPTTYSGLLSYMAKNMFDDLADVDQIDL